MTVKTVLLAFALLSISALPTLAQQNSQSYATTVSLSAEGVARAVPDIATINLGVETEAPTAADALRQNRVQMIATIAALKAQGILAKDIQTSGLNLNPQSIFRDNERKLTGYQASNAVTVVVRDLGHLGATVDAVVSAGANQIVGVAFGLSDLDQAEDEARRAAVKALQAKAQLYAEATGYRVDRLVSLSDTNIVGGSRPAPLVSIRKVAAPTPTEPGELDITATVSAIYELKK